MSTDAGGWRAVDVEGHGGQTLSPAFRPDPAPGRFQQRLAQDLQVCRRGHHHTGADQRREIVGHSDRAARIVQLHGHPRHDPAAFHHLAQHHGPRIARQPV